MSFTILHGYKDDRLVEELRKLEVPLCLVDLNTVPQEQLFDVITGFDTDIVVYVDSKAVKLRDNWLDELLQPLAQPSVKLTYCDFVSNGVPIFHTTLPSNIGFMPLCAFRKDIIKETVPDLLQKMLGNVMSRYIPELLVEIDDPSQ
jgi:hypothetical protein